MSIVSCSTTSTTAYKVAADTTGTLVFQTGASPTTALTIDGSQNVINQAQTTPPTLTVNNQMVMNLTSNTNLRISVRGSDGTTRVANITLA
jgi:hypothetical protein